MLVEFKLSCVLPQVATVIVKVGDKIDAKKDALTAAHSEFGPTARVIGDGSPVYSIDPVCDLPAEHAFSNGEQWAWFGVSK